jgi:hypothetical protein
MLINFILDIKFTKGIVNMKMVVTALSIFLLSWAANSTNLVGSDFDNDGVRDDVEVAIYKLYSHSKDNREVSRNAAKVYQMILTAGNSADNLDDNKISEELAKLASCYIDHTNLDGRKEAAKIKFLVFNTKDRLAAFEKYQSGRNGTVQKVVNVTYEECRLPQN